MQHCNVFGVDHLTFEGGVCVDELDCARIDFSLASGADNFFLLKSFALIFFFLYIHYLLQGFFSDLV